MIQTIQLSPGVVLRHYPDKRFKTAVLSVQFLRPLCREEAALNALLSAVLLRGTEKNPDMRSITARLDDLYGAHISPHMRRIGDIQTIGLFLSCLEDRFALPGDRVLAPMVAFLGELLLDSPLKDGAFLPEFVEGEKKNLIATIESELNDKRAYAMGRLLKTMCREDTFGLPRLGETEQVAAIQPDELYHHYCKILRESRIQIFYVGSAQPETLRELLMPLVSKLGRSYVNLPAQTAFSDTEGSHISEEMDVSQGKLCMGFTTSITNRDKEFPAMQLMNTIFGAGMTSKLFMNVREKLSLCYNVGSGYYGTKGIVTVSAGIDFDKEQQTREEILRQLTACQEGRITPVELTAAKESVLSSLRSTHDTPGAIEGYYATAALSGMAMTPKQYMDALEAVTLEQVAAAARTVRLHSSFFLKGVSQ